MNPIKLLKSIIDKIESHKNMTDFICTVRCEGKKDAPLITTQKQAAKAINAMADLSLKEVKSALATDIKVYIKEIIERKKQGIDCSEEESAEIKMYIKESILMVGDGSLEINEDLQMHFPAEYGEAIDEITSI